MAELPMPSSFRLPRSLRPLVLLESDDPPRLFAAAAYPLALLLPTFDRPLFLELLALDEPLFAPLFEPLEELLDEPLMPSP